MKQQSNNHDKNEEQEKQQIREYFGNKKKGACIEVGANEPISICSQSWHLEDQLDWQCILIEPNPILADKAKQLRPKAITFNYACVSKKNMGEMELHIPISQEGECITGHASLVQNVDEHNYNKHKTIRVKTDTLSNIIKMSNIGDADLISIDVEGAELEVLKGLDFETFKPQLILLEDKHLYLAKHRLLKKNGYILAQRLNRNSWYIPKGAPVPEVKATEKIKLFKRLYLSIWLKKIHYAIRHKTLQPFMTL
jgi:FkbM family methyltransferase